jgi:hypothetical protein
VSNEVLLQGRPSLLPLREKVMPPSQQAQFGQFLPQLRRHLDQPGGSALSEIARSILRLQLGRSLV